MPFEGVSPVGSSRVHINASQTWEVVETVIRPTGPGDLARLREIERAAGERFRDFGLDHVADDEPLSLETLAAYAEAGRSWVAVGTENEPLGYLLVAEVGGAAHIEQVSVLPEFQGRGVGKALIDQAKLWAVARGLPAITLTTFSNIPWNQPLYEHLGFRVLPEDSLGPELLEVRDEETSQGLDPRTRVAMRLDL